jgi:excisionase family DNA binding protein
MAQKFVPLEDAAKQLGISKERLNELREGGKVRAYRDGASWKFRSEDLSALSDELAPAKDPSVSDIALEALDEPSDPADSILVSDAEVGESPNRPPSTVIGEKRGKSAGDSDLELALDEGSSKGGLGSGRSSAGASDVLASASGSNVLGPSETPPVPSGKFEDLDEIDIDLETESSKIHSDIDLPRGKSTERESDLQLVDSGIGGPSPSGSGGSEIRLAEDEDDDLVLSESGSDVTLAPGDSGINLISPSDSGLALDDLDLDLAGSSASKLELDEAGEEQVVLEEEPPRRTKSAAKDDDFLLTPLGEAGEDDSSSQVIELDSEAELHESTAIITDRPEETAILEPVEEEEEGVFAERGAAVPLGMAPVGVPAQAIEFSGANVAFLILCLVVLALCGIMMLDLLRQIWSWDQPFSINSTLIEALNFFD